MTFQSLIACFLVSSQTNSGGYESFIQTTGSMKADVDGPTQRTNALPHTHIRMNQNKCRCKRPKLSEPRNQATQRHRPKGTIGLSFQCFPMPSSPSALVPKRRRTESRNLRRVVHSPLFKFMRGFETLNSKFLLPAGKMTCSF